MSAGPPGDDDATPGKRRGRPRPRGSGAPPPPAPGSFRSKAPPPPPAPAAAPRARPQPSATAIKHLEAARALLGTPPRERPWSSGYASVADDAMTQVRDSEEIHIDLGLDSGETAADRSLGGPLTQHDVLGHDELPKGTIIGRYVVVERIGTGGMGSVYSAYDPELDRKVAVKVLHRVPGSQTKKETARARLVREAQALAKVSHPAVVTVHDVGFFGDRVFMAMEFVEGRTLAKWVKEEKPSWREIVKVFRQAGQGLAAAHAAGLIHRDFKPTNVILSPAGRIRILDFGLARRADTRSSSHGSEDRSAWGDSSETSSSGPDWTKLIRAGEQTVAGAGSSLDMQLTQAGAIMGSPPYMAPEQHMSKPTDARSDIYSFCATMYEALYDARPYVSQDARMMIFAIMEGRMHKPARDSGVPTWLRKVLLRGLAPEPNDRYPSMHDLLADLTRDSSKKIRNLALVVGALVLVVGLGTAVALPYLSPPAVEVSANAAVDQLVDEAHEAAARALFVYPPPDDPDAATALSRVLALEGFEGEGADLAAAKAAQLRKEFASTLLGIGDRYWAEEDGKVFATDYYAQALVFDDTLERARERAGTSPEQLATLRDKAAKTAFSTDELRAAEPLAVLAEPDDDARQEKLDAMIAEADAGHRSIAEQEKLQKLASSKQSSGRKKPRSRPRPTPKLEPVTPPPAPTPDKDPKPSKDRGNERAKARELAKEGVAALRATNYQEASRLFERALGLDRRCGPALIGLSDLHFQRSEYAKALTYAEQAVGAAPRNVGYQLKLGDVYYKVVRYDEAKKAYEAAKSLGSEAAEGRLERVAKKLGG